MILLCTGIFTWNGSERRSNRYGSFWMASAPYNGDTPATPPKLHREAIDSLVGKRVRIEVKVIEGRPSGHIGDLFLGIGPNPLSVGRSIELAIGTLFTATQDGGWCSWCNPTSRALTAGSTRASSTSSTIRRSRCGLRRAAPRLTPNIAVRWLRMRPL